MSQQPQPSGLDGLTELEALAMDHALGGGSRAERKAAELRLLSDPEFRAAVERWQVMLAPLDDVTPGIALPPSVWAGFAGEIEPPPRRAAPQPAVSGGWWNSVGLWRGLAFAGPVLAAVAVAVLVHPDAVAPGVPATVAGGPALVATLADADGRPLIAAAYDPASGQVRDVTGQNIEGLYCAGEMVGGLFYFSYPSGTGLVSGAVFGRLAGDNAGLAAMT